MKQLIALALSVLMLFSIAACGNTPEETTAPETSAPETSAPETEAPANDNVILPTMAENTWGAAFWADFEAAVAANKGEAADVIATAIHGSTSGMAMGMSMVMPMEAGYFQGFTEDVTGFKTASVIAPMMSGTLMVYVFELAEDANVREFVTKLNETSDPAWMICMTAETTTIGAIDNYVLAAYAPTAMPGDANAPAVVIDPVTEEGSREAAIWSEFVSYMENFGSTSIAIDVADAIAMGGAIGADAEAEAIDEMEIEIEGFQWAIDGHNNAAVVKAGELSVYVFQLDPGMSADAWGDWNLGSSNVPEGAKSAWGAYGEMLVMFYTAA